MKKAILTVSFGTSHLDTLEKTIGAIERELAEAFSDRTLYRAFTSGMVIEKLKLDHKLVIFRVEEAMEQMYRDGVREVLVQPTHIIHGLEYEKMRSQLAPYQERFSQVRIGAPLLEATKDYEEAAGLIIEDVRPGDGESLVLMGHGTEHHTNAAYPALDYTFWAKGYKNVIVGTVEGFPEMDEVLKKLKEQQTKRVLLMPFMVVAGDCQKRYGRRGRGLLEIHSDCPWIRGTSGNQGARRNSRDPADVCPSCKRSKGRIR